MENRIKECQFDLYADRTSTATMRANQLRRCCAILEEYLSDRGGGLGVDFAEGFFFQSGDAVLELTVLHAAELRFDELTCALSERSRVSDRASGRHCSRRLSQMGRS
jgi:citrate lyase alpha subunit